MGDKTFTEGLKIGNLKTPSPNRLLGEESKGWAWGGGGESRRRSGKT